MMLNGLCMVQGGYQVLKENIMQDLELELVEWFTLWIVFSLV